ncbi:DUF1272 domain-containing protein [Actinomycetospora endophytica]|uniref:DUF1272 domain-containing protein n=1 Tax=Actinomycetospora endophytica TaxID=2291215 RepID=A0ABS8PIR3_9PSEU|nr:DUF1272 domain-containing protein [Actinomycetospora endophytica]MCD2198166.1 DUF1272 domain-containing protein [Actinomycetospora endophytica]
MLEMRPGCERCDADLAPESPEARICSFECTFCASCAEGPLEGRCPNCGGGFTPRPARATALLDRFPATTERTYHPPVEA